MVRGSPCMCIRHTPASDAAMASTAPEARSAPMSLIIDAPAPSAARMTSGLIVSTETGTGASFSPSRTGMSRSSSSSAEIPRAPGRLDSAPMSRRSAPSAISDSACATAACGSRKRPPSEKEAGVTLTTPMRSGRDTSSLKRPQRKAGVEPGIGLSRLGLGGAWRAAGLGRLLRRLRRLGRTRRLPAHDVVDLVGVYGFPLEQRLRHRLDLVAVVDDQLPRERVLLVDDLADLLIDLLQRRLGHVLVRGDRAAEEHLALVLAVHHRAELVGHAPLGDHVARDGRRALEVVRRAG